MNKNRLWNAIRFSLSFLVLFGIWLVLSPSRDSYNLGMGALAALGCAALTYRVFLEEHEASWRFLIPRPWALVIYLGRLLFQIYLSSFQVLAAFFLPRARPRIVHFRTRLKSDLARMFLCNSITLTPGTVTLDLNDDHLTVYWFFAHTTHSRAAGEAVKGPLEEDLRRVWS